MSGPSMDRRTFLKRSAQVGAGAAAVGLAAGLGARPLLRRLERPWDAAAFPPPGTAAVAVVPAASYDVDLEGLVLEGLRAIGADLRGRSVLLKPNLVEFDPGTVVNTDPRVVAATVLAARRLGARTVVVGEGPGHRRDTGFVLRTSRLLETLETVDAPFVDLNTDAAVRIPLRSHFTDLRELWLPESIASADVVISMPKMKTHHWAGVTLSLKNCFGCVPGRVYGWPKNVLHWAGLEDAIVDVAAAVSPELQIVDGIVGMEGNGPIDGTPIASGVLVFGSDPVATDVTSATLMGLDPERIGYLQQAARFLGQGDLERIRQVGEDPERSATSFAVLPRFAGLRVGSSGDGGTGSIGPG